MLEGEISPILGLSLLELIDVVSIATIISGAAAAIGIGFSAYNTHKRNKVISSELIITMLNRLREEDFRNVFNNMKQGNYVSDLNLRRYLTYLEYIALFCHDGVLNFYHIDQIFGANFRLLNKNKQALAILDNIPAHSDLYFHVNKIRRRLV